MILIDPRKFMRKLVSEVKHLLDELVRHGIELVPPNPDPRKTIMAMKVVDDAGPRHLDERETRLAPGATLTLYLDFPRGCGADSRSAPGRAGDPPGTEAT